MGINAYAAVDVGTGTGANVEAQHAVYTELGDKCMRLPSELKGKVQNLCLICLAVLTSICMPLKAVSVCFKLNLFQFFSVYEFN